MKNVQRTAGRQTYTGIILAIGLAILFSDNSAAHAALVTALNPVGNRSFQGVVGIRFSVGLSDVAVTALGFEDSGSNGLDTTHGVAIWTAGGSMLGSVTVQAGTVNALVDNYRYATLSSPVTLSAGATYVIAAETTGALDMFTDRDFTGGNLSSFVLDPQLVGTNPSNVFSFSSYPSFPNQDGTGTDYRWAPANAQFGVVAVPEPTSLALLSLVAGGGVLVRLRRRRSTAAETMSANNVDK